MTEALLIAYIILAWSVIAFAPSGALMRRSWRVGRKLGWIGSYCHSSKNKWMDLFFLHDVRAGHKQSINFMKGLVVDSQGL